MKDLKTDTYRPAIPDPQGKIRQRFKKAKAKSELSQPAFLRKIFEAGLSLVESQQQ